MMLIPNAIAIGGLAALASAQFPPHPRGQTILKSKFHENVTISFKEPGICETTPGVKSYSGYIHLPPGFLNDGIGEAQNYPINTFFWFFEARTNPANAPLAIWLNGGPGASSMMGLLEENGPCFVASDSKTTYLNPLSWNNEVNMLYLDQPTQVGFSYDVLTIGTMRPSEDGQGFETIPGDFTDGVPENNYTNRVGTFSSQEPSQTAHRTQQAAHALWHFSQTWFFEFPYYKPVNNRISLWAESYGGHYGPGFFRFFQEQNEMIVNDTSGEQDAHYLHLDTLGIVNGHVDMVLQGEEWIRFPYNNTYGIQVYDQSLYDDLMYNWTRPQGCRERHIACRDALKASGRVSISSKNSDLAKLCGTIADDCIESVIDTYFRHGRAAYDIGHPNHDPFPLPHMYGYLTEESVLSALGVPVNYTEIAGAVAKGFVNSYDIDDGSFLESVAYLLDAGVKVHLMYGDRDYMTSWVGGERVSLAIQHRRAADFATAGYTPLVTADAGVKGMTRQHGNLSFSRVFQSGHEVPTYQPVAAHEIFRRAMFNLDIATGLVPVTDDLATVGPRDIWHVKNVPPKMPAPRCYVLKPVTCLPEVWETVSRGTAVVKDWFVISDDSADIDHVEAANDGAQLSEEL